MKLLGWKTHFLTAGGRLVLTKHVLQAVPVHCLACLDPPKNILLRLEKLFAKFLWSSNDGNNRYVWRSWERMAFPFDENGLGLRRLKDIIDSFSCKLLWKIHLNKGIWAHYINAITLLRSSSKRRLLRVAQTFEENTCMIIRDGSSSFWNQNWLGDGLVRTIEGVNVSSNLLLRDVLVDGIWKMDLIEDQILPADKDRLRQSNLYYSNGSDFMAWKPQPSGEFSVCSAYEKLRQQNEINTNTKLIWSQFLPQKISFFGWRLWNGLLPFQHSLSKMGIQMASKCPFCEHDDSMNHFFLNCRTASTLWVFIENWLQISIPYCYNVRDLMSHCFAQNREPIVKMIPLLVMWTLWRRRTSIMYGDGTFNHKRMFSFVTSLLQGISFRRPIPTSHLHPLLLAQKGIQVKQMNYRQKLVYWSPPLNHKLNTDGSLMNGNAASAFVLRDTMGHFIIGENFFLGPQTILYAETHAILEGLRKCMELGYKDFDLSTDSSILVRFLNQGSHWPWALYYMLAEISKLISLLRVKISHTFREGNRVADALVKDTISTGVSKCYNHTNIPGFLKGLLLADKLNIPNIRTTCKGAS